MDKVFLAIWLFVYPILAVSLALEKNSSFSNYPMPTSSIRIRDPFILADNATGRYYMYASLGNRYERPEDAFVGDTRIPHGVEVYVSPDLNHWAPAQRVMSLVETNHSNGELMAVWAPEVHYYDGTYYMFATIVLKKDGEGTAHGFSRRVHILHADTPLGPFVSSSSKSITPTNWMAIDGTLSIENGKPYMVFVHEWTQITVGSMELMELSPDLSNMVGKTQTLFRATDPPWAGKNYITDGPSLYRLHSGTLLMLWSNNNLQGKYCVGIARSVSGKLAGPWKQDPEPLVTNGGHGMIFQTFTGKLLLVLHGPNTPGEERAHFIEITESDTTLSAELSAEEK